MSNHAIKLIHKSGKNMDKLYNENRHANYHIFHK